MLQLAAGVLLSALLAAGISRKRRDAKRKRETDSSDDGGATESESLPDGAGCRALLSRTSRELQNDGGILSPKNGGPLIGMTIMVLWRDQQCAPRKKRRRGGKESASDSEWWTATVLKWRPQRWWRSDYGYNLLFEARHDEEPTVGWMGEDLNERTWMFQARCQVDGCGKERKPGRCGLACGTTFCIRHAKELDPVWHQAYKQDRGLCEHAGCDKQRPTDKHDNRRTAYCFRHAKELDPVWHQAYELAHPRCQCNRVECQRGPAQQRFNLWCLQCVAVENPRDERLPLRNGLRAKESAVRVCLRQVGRFSIILTAPSVPNFNCDIVGAMTATPALKLWCEVQEGQHGHGQRVEGVPKGRYPRATESLKLLTTLNELLERCPHIVRIDFNPDGYQSSDGERIPSCWHGSAQVNPTQLATWEKRLATLVAVANVSFGVSPLCADNII